MSRWMRWDDWVDRTFYYGVLSEELSKPDLLVCIQRLGMG